MRTLRRLFRGQVYGVCPDTIRVRPSRLVRGRYVVVDPHGVVLFSHPDLDLARAWGFVVARTFKDSDNQQFRLLITSAEPLTVKE